MLSNAYFLAKFRFDTAENEPARNLQKFAKFVNFADSNPLTRVSRERGPGSIPASTAGCASGRRRARAIGQINMYGKMPAAWLEERLLSQEATHSSIILSAVQLDDDIGQTSK